MPAMFGGTPIGAMQYGGTPIAEAMIDGVVVWRRIITVTPPAPTFLDGAPWIELPTVEGVTYTVAGTPGPGETITVTATPDEGYELDGTTSWQHTYPLPVVQITGTSGNQSRDQFRQACVDHGTTYDTAETLPFLLDTSQATIMYSMFDGCSSLTSVPDMDTSNVTAMGSMFLGCSSLTSAPDMDTSNVTTMFRMFDGCSSLTSVPDMDASKVRIVEYMFRNCSSLTDGNVRLIGGRPTYTRDMILGSGLTRRPFYDTNGNPI